MVQLTQLVILLFGQNASCLKNFCFYFCDLEPKNANKQMRPFWVIAPSGNKKRNKKMFIVDISKIYDFKIEAQRNGFIMKLGSD